MSKREKALERLGRLPSDYRWEELESLLVGLGFELRSKSGSHVRFYRESDKTVIDACKPHPTNTMKRYAIRQIYECLKERGEIDE